MELLDRGELEQVLAAHAARYPLMEPRDAVKLLFQRVFGGGHLIAAPEESFARLQAEAAATPYDPSAPLFEELGSGMVRVQLSALDGENYPLEALNRDFVRSARLRRGDQDAFRWEAEVLRAMAARGALPFSAQDLERELAPYLAAGCPPLSHSARYRDAYRPAYRVLCVEPSLPHLIQRAEETARVRGQALVALDGRCASGKTTLARRLQERRGWAVVHMDHFFPRPEQRTPARYATPGENVDHERFLEEVLLPLRRGERPAYRPFDCHARRLGDPIQVPAAPVVLIEGSYACHPALRASYDLRAFLTVSPEEQARRILARNGPETAQVFQTRWIPLEETYFSACGVAEACQYALETEAMQ